MWLALRFGWRTPTGVTVSVAQPVSHVLCGGASEFVSVRRTLSLKSP